MTKPTISSLTEQMISEFDEDFVREEDDDNYPGLVYESPESLHDFIQTHFRTAAEQLLDSVREEDKITDDTWDERMWQYNG